MNTSPQFPERVWKIITRQSLRHRPVIKYFDNPVHNGIEYLSVQEKDAIVAEAEKRGEQKAYDEMCKAVPEVFRYLQERANGK